MRKTVPFVVASLLALGCSSGPPSTKAPPPPASSAALPPPPPDTAPAASSAPPPPPPPVVEELTAEKALRLITEALKEVGGDPDHVGRLGLLALHDLGDNGRLTKNWRDMLKLFADPATDEQQRMALAVAAATETPGSEALDAFCGTAASEALKKLKKPFKMPELGKAIRACAWEKKLDIRDKRALELHPASVIVAATAHQLLLATAKQKEAEMQITKFAALRGLPPRK